jgi:hypothetical protein
MFLSDTTRNNLLLSKRTVLCTHWFKDLKYSLLKDLYLTEQSVQDSTLLCVDGGVFFAVQEAC